MKHFLLLVFIICSQISFAQYTFKYNSKITELEAVGIDNYALINEKYHSKSYKTSLGDTVTIKPRIVVIVKDEAYINTIISQFDGKISFKEKIGRMHIFNCHVQNSDEVLAMTSTLCNDENVIGCEAICNTKIKAFNPLYSKQYYLHNTNGIDINAEPAWNIATSLGKNITVAIIDEGVDHNHEDLKNVLNGYTVGGGNGEPTNPVPDTLKAHGTACAGIIGSNNNSIGTRGIASSINILPVNIRPFSKFSDYDKIAAAIEWASERADILSCSWGGYFDSMAIREAIKDALTKGRNGKGCIVVFASGNNAKFFPNNIAFPASVDGVISVGAVDRNGNIWDYSQRGTGLCLVAPSGTGDSSSDIVTTDRMGSLGYTPENYTEHFGGTSAACPQVAGVAALMLSVNPNLTNTEVKNALQKSATDLGPTGYDTTYGYGLLNAYAAIKEIAPYISGPAIAKSKNSFKILNSLEEITVNWSVQDKDKNSIKMTVSGLGNQECTLELNGNKTIRTTLTATVNLNGEAIATVTKDIVLIGALSGTYSVPATTVNGTSFPAITNRPFGEGSTLEAHAGASMTITSEDLRYYTPSWSGNRIENWKYNGNTLSFAYPKNTTSALTVLTFKCDFGGSSVRVNVRPVQPPYSMNISQDGGILSVNISKEEQTYEAEYEENVPMELLAKEASHIWTIEVLNATTGIRQDKAITSTGEYQFNTVAWPSGIYIIRASNGNNTISEKVVIK